MVTTLDRDAVARLVERFDREADFFRSERYNEAQARRELIDPLFRALGWDVHNAEGVATPNRPVIHEDQVLVGGKVEHPDYAFRVDGRRKFFVEAKRPASRIRIDRAAAYQVQRYAWSASIPVSFVTDFEELAIYDCRQVPSRDQALTAQADFIYYHEYRDNWDKLVGLLSYDAVRQGALEEFVVRERGDQSIFPLDSKFLIDLNSWRAEMARYIAGYNPTLDAAEVNYAVQRTLERILFLRICEERGLERDSLETVMQADYIYKALIKRYHEADHRYNSGLFRFGERGKAGGEADVLTLSLTIPDIVFEGIIPRLYHQASPYEFSQIPVEILGQVYEQFLGKVIQLSPDRTVTLVEKPEVRKAGGIFYTPSYIVEYIVDRTLAPLLEEHTPEEVTTLRICDPACGSGSFLLGAYQYLLEWHQHWYVTNDPEQHPEAITWGQDNEWHLTLDLRKRILCNNIYGVDLDPDAVAWTRHSLLLKVLDDVSPAAAQYEREFHEAHLLPDLDDNIRCGNSLVGGDFPDLAEAQDLDQATVRQVRAFNWEHAFKFIRREGGFDAIIGNPPYVRQEGLGTLKSYYQAHYRTFQPTADLYVNFVEKGLRLLKSTGRFGMIISNKWLRAAYGKPLRTFLSQQTTVEEVVDFAGLPVFTGATVRTIILICSPTHAPGGTVRYLAPLPLAEFRTLRSAARLREFVKQCGVDLPAVQLSPGSWSFSGGGHQNLLDQLRHDAVPLKQYMGGRMFRGVVTGMNEAFIIDRNTRDKLVAEDAASEEIIKPVLAGRDIHRYAFTFADRYLIFARRGVNIEQYPSVLRYLEQYHADLTPKRDPKDARGRKPGKYQWYEIQDTIEYHEAFAQPKIIYPDIATSCRFTLDRNGYFSANTTYFLPCEDLYLLGLLNSRLAQFYFTEVCAGLEGGGTTYLRFFGQYLEGFPVRRVCDESSDDHKRRDRISSLVRRMLKLHCELDTALINRRQVEDEIANVDMQIDQLVYELYRLSDRDIGLVEARTQ